jgi:hypothetical protein
MEMSMEQKNDGGSAFPRYGNDPWGQPSTQAAGMTLRDYFAAKAMMALTGDSGNYEAAIQAAQKKGEEAASFISASAYELADAMLAERVK